MHRLLFSLLTAGVLGAIVWGLIAWRSLGTRPAITAGFSALGDSPQPAEFTMPVSEEHHAVQIRRPDGPPRVRLASSDPQGRAAEVACSTCHSIRPPDFTNTSHRLNEFHQGFILNHGNLTCYACHDARDADALRLADGTRVEYRDVMQLCSQCHGPQATAFAHGAHGGMTGYWDLRRGPQVKNNCIDCHDPHEPAYPRMMVQFKPKDRFDTPGAAAGAEH